MNPEEIVKEYFDRWNKGDVDGAAVLVQEGSREKPGVILGAAFTPLGATLTPVRQQTIGDQ